MSLHASKGTRKNRPSPKPQLSSNERKEQRRKHKARLPPPPLPIITSSEKEKMEAREQANTYLIDYNKIHPDSPLPIIDVKTGKINFGGKKHRNKKNKTKKSR